MRLVFIVWLFMVLTSSCKKEAVSTVRVRYEVLIKNGNSVGISCYNDYYYDSGNLNRIDFTSTNNYFKSDRTATDKEQYYLKVEPLNLVSDTVNFQATVYINDTIKDQYTSVTRFNTIVLTGNLK